MKKVSSLISFLVLLVFIPHSSADDRFFEDRFMPGEFEEFSLVADGIQQVFDSPTWINKHKGKVLVSVDRFGAIGDGVSDDTQAFVKAWNKACSTPESVFLVPKGRRYLVKQTKFEGPCVDKLVIQINGTIVAPDEPSDWDLKSSSQWLQFSNLKRVTFQGGGFIDGSGSKWWASSCKKNKDNPCRAAPTAIMIDSSSMVELKDLTIKNSPQMHFVIYRSNVVRVSDIQISAPYDSPNTDGIHIAESTNVVLQNCKIGTGDDCVSIVNASSVIKMKNIYCGPGHGISIGSLGKDNSTGIVSQVVLDTAFLKETTNGLRIKTWQGGSGFVRSVRFENVRMEEVENPIIIDQFYCDSPKTCQNQTSAVKVSQVIYRNVTGTTKSSEAIKFACSDSVPCSTIILGNVNLESKEGTAKTYCNSAMGFDYGAVHPSVDCLLSEKDSHSKQTIISRLEKSSSFDDLHSEL